MTKFIIITGGVISGLGKGVLLASIGKLLSTKYKCAAIKCDGYLNIEPGKINSIEHGEVFVLDDGTECDMDFGHYERFMGVKAKKEWSLTMGKIYESIFEKEKKGEYLGKTIQLVPHVTNEIKEKILNVAKKENAEVLLIEIGGTVGDIENMLYIEAIRQLSLETGRKNSLFIHLSFVPIPVGVGEQKSKPTQLSVKTLNELGVWPDLIIARCEEYLDPKIKKKISLFCNVSEESVLTAIDVPSVYLIPSELEKQGFLELVSKKLGLSVETGLIEEWNKLALRMNGKNWCEEKVVVGIIGEKDLLSDANASVTQALNHASANLNKKICTKIISVSEELSEEEIKKTFEEISGLIIPRTFFKKIINQTKLINYARKNNFPLIGVGEGFYSIIFEYLKNECGFSGELKEIFAENELREKSARKGLFETNLIKESWVKEIYLSEKIFERHRHNYEINSDIFSLLKKKGMVLSGFFLEKNFLDLVELPKQIHSFFVASIFSPELISNLEKPSPIFLGFLKKVIESKK